MDLAEQRRCPNAMSKLVDRVVIVMDGVWVESPAMTDSGGVQKRLPKKGLAKKTLSRREHRAQSPEMAFTHEVAAEMDPALSAADLLWNQAALATLLRQDLAYAVSPKRASAYTGSPTQVSAQAAVPPTQASAYAVSPTQASAYAAAPGHVLALAAALAHTSGCADMPKQFSAYAASPRTII
ncbi:hypothetical protein CKAH01_10753 [Colletotrichum kahawae]|uniref:Uncharacterized protein n=1 Tax=Colletotrichum kahawae TaxID=34407 RepID=A0AAD9XY16_COLKA|nr:hypothetical protein CKAH01_10753 [Colletotrichum kahawae]